MIVDTNALFAFIEGDAAAGELMRQQSRVCIPVIVLGEFRYGIASSRHRVIYEQWLDLHTPHFDVLPVTANTAVTYAEIRDILKEQGTPIPAHNLWIAALAREHRLPVLSRDQHFDGIPGVIRQTW